MGELARLVLCEHYDKFTCLLQQSTKLVTAGFMPASYVHGKDAAATQNQVLSWGFGHEHSHVIYDPQPYNRD